MPAPFSILTLDFHNTIYDEVMEYGLSIDEAVNVWLEEALKRDRILDGETVYKELAVGHKRLGSDWDADVWQYLPSLARLNLDETEFKNTAALAEKRRRMKSRQLMLGGFYDGTLETLNSLKSRGVRICVVTEASADTAMQGIAWLKLGGIVDGVYSYPSRNAPQTIGGTFHKTFITGDDGHYKKPHPYLLASVVLDEAIRKGDIPDGVSLTDVFQVVHQDAFVIPELPDVSPVQADAAAQIEVLETPYAEVLRHTLSSMLYVGDSKFKDGMLARNAGCAYAYAAYGKKVKEGTLSDHQKSLRIMYAVTGWDAETIQLTQEASSSKTVSAFVPDYTFENSLSEALGLFIGA